MVERKTWLVAQAKEPSGENAAQGIRVAIAKSMAQAGACVLVDDVRINKPNMI